jgi:hypothetical protein
MVRFCFAFALTLSTPLLSATLVQAEEPRPAALKSTDATIAPFPAAVVQNLWVQRIWTDGRHNGFPGIARVGDYYYVAFRNSTSHKDKSAKIMVIRAAVTDLTKWAKVAEFTRDHDCRDPLVFDNRGKVQVVFHSKEDFYSQSTDGLTWTEPQELQTEFLQPTAANPITFSSQRRWLFRIRRGPDGAFYSLGRCGIKESGGTFGLVLFRSEDGITFKPLHDYGQGPTSALAAAGGVGWGHEADVAWTPDGTLVAAIRNGKPGIVVFGRAPLGPWKGFQTDAWNFGGPALHMTNRGGILLAARALPERDNYGFPSVAKVWTVTAEGVEKPWIVPSSGDGAYQSFVDGPTAEEVLLVYYSSHEHPQPGGVGENPTNLYLAHLKIRHQDRPVVKESPVKKVEPVKKEDPVKK